MTPSAIFLSYRRSDSEGQSGRLFSDLGQAFGKDRVLIDVVGMDKGLDFRRTIDQRLEGSAVLLAVIGKSWLDVRDDAGQRRLDDPRDLVRLETLTALKRDLRVIPVLVGGAAMPRQSDLPPALKALAYRDGIELRHTSWDVDVQRLIDVLRPLLDGPPAPAATATLLPPPTAALATAPTPPNATATAQTSAPAAARAPTRSPARSAARPAVSEPAPTPTPTSDGASGRRLLIWTVVLGGSALTAWFGTRGGDASGGSDAVDAPTVAAAPSTQPTAPPASSALGSVPGLLSAMASNEAKKIGAMVSGVQKPQLPSSDISLRLAADEAAKLDTLLLTLRQTPQARVDVVKVLAFAAGVSGDAYAAKVSQQVADTVRAHLVAGGIDPALIRTEVEVREPSSELQSRQGGAVVIIAGQQVRPGQAAPSPLGLVNTVDFR